MLTLHEIEAAAQVVYREFQATPQYRWALSSQRLGTHCWIKHENHTPVGAFKLRGGLTYFDALASSGTLPAEVISATRGNHGQSIGWAARAHGVPCTIVVPHGNSLASCAAGRALDHRRCTARAADMRAPELHIHCIVDNHATHSHPKIKAWLASRARWHMHFIPTNRYWLNRVERFFALNTDKAMRRGLFTCSAISATTGSIALA